MKIAVVTGEFPKLSETFVLNQVTGLLDRGHDVHVFASKPGDDGKVHHAITEYALAARTTYWPRVLERAARPVESLRRLRHGRAGVGAWGFPNYGSFDVIYCHFGHVAERARELREAQVFSGKLVAVFHAWDLTVLFGERPVHFYDRLFAEAELLLPISELWARKLLSLGAPPDKVKVHRMGIQVDQFTFRERSLPAGGAVRLVSVARLVEKKGIEFAIRALSRVKSRHPELSFRYDIAGDGELRAWLEQLVDESSLEAEVTFHGWMDQSEVVDLLEEAHVLLVPSVTARNGDMEGLPVVLMEGMARGLPVVATRHSGIPELVEDGVSGLLVEERDVEGLAKALETTMLAPDSWPRLGRAGRAAVEREFEIEVLNDQLSEMLRRL